MVAVDDGRKDDMRGRRARELSRAKHTPLWRSIVIASICLLPLSSTASEPMHQVSKPRLLYGWWWGGIEVYDLERGVRLGMLKGFRNVVLHFVLGKTDAFLLSGHTVYDYRVGSLTVTHTLSVGSDSLIGETDGHPILQNDSTVSVRDMSGKTISVAPADGGGSTAAFDSLRHRVASASNDRVQIWDTANGHLTRPRRIIAQAGFLRFDYNGDLIVSAWSSGSSLIATRYAFESDGSIRKVDVHARRSDVYRSGRTRVTADSGCPGRPQISWGDMSSVELVQPSEQEIRGVVLDAALGTVIATAVCVTSAAPHILDGRILIFGKPAKLSRTIVSLPALSWIYLTYR